MIDSLCPNKLIIQSVNLNDTRHEAIAYPYFKPCSIPTRYTQTELDYIINSNFGQHKMLTPFDSCIYIILPWRKIKRTKIISAIWGTQATGFFGWCLGVIKGEATAMKMDLASSLWIASDYNDGHRGSVFRDEASWYAWTCQNQDSLCILFMSSVYSCTSNRFCCCRW